MENKNCYYLRLKENFFESDELKILESMENGYLYSNILLKLYLKALKTNGRLTFNEYIPYNVKMLATITGHNIDVTEKALNIFKSMGLIDVLDNGAIYMMNIQEMIGSISSEGIRKAEYRKRIKLEKQNGTKLGQCPEKTLTGTNLGQCPDILDIDIDIEKESTLKSTKEKDVSLSLSKEENKSSTKVFVAPSLDEIIAYATQWGHPEIAEKFYNYYSVGNWKDRDGRKIKNWKQKMQTWFDKERTNNSQQVSIQSSSQVEFKDLMMEYSRLTTNQERYDWFWKHKDIEFKSSYDKSEFITTYSLLVNEMAKELTKEEQIKWYEDCRKFYN